GQPVGRLARELHGDAAAGELCSGARAQGGYLGPQLAWQPPVVVVAERDEVGARGQDSAVPRASEAGRPLVRQNENLAWLSVPGQVLIDWRAVEDRHDLQPPLVVLGEHRRDGFADLIWAVSGRDADADRWQRAHAARPM